MLREKALPYLIATSALSMADDPRERFSIPKTIEYAKRIGAEGIQLYINQVGEEAGKIPPAEVYRRLTAAELTSNIVHLGGILTTESFGRTGADMLRNAARMVDPFPGLGIVCIIHNDPVATESPKIVAAMTKQILGRADERIVLGYEFVPHRINGELSDQADRALEVFHELLVQGVTVIPVIDARNLHDMSGGVQFEDPGDAVLDKLCKAATGGKALIQARDVLSIKAAYTKGNFRPLGQGSFAQFYRKLFVLGRKYRIDWQALIDENQEAVLQNRRDIDATFERLGFGESRAY
jgi:hypothetical protein